MSWTFVWQLAILALIAAFIVLVLAEAFRTPGNRRQGSGPVGPPGPPGPPGPMGLSGPPGPGCTGPCCRPTNARSVL